MREYLVRLRRHLVTGLIVVAPIAVTIYALVLVFNFLDNLLGPHLRSLVGRSLPGLGIVVLLLLLLGVGWASRRAAGRRLVGWGNEILSRFPVTRKLYNASSQIVQSVLDRDEKLFQGVALAEYPMTGSWTLVFPTSRAPSQVEGKIGERAVSVFLPTVPNPTTGYLLILPASRVQMLDMTVEEGFKMVISAGVAVPGVERVRVTGLDIQRLLRETGSAIRPETGREARPGPGGEARPETGGEARPERASGDGPESGSG